VGRANDQVFNDNLRTALATSRVGRDVDRAEALGLKIAAAPDPLAAERLRTQLLQTAVPLAETDLARLLKLHAEDPPDELRQIERISRSTAASRGSCSRA
jgi:D-mannonate dehydratase